MRFSFYTFFILVGAVIAVVNLIFAVLKDRRFQSAVDNNPGKITKAQSDYHHESYMHSLTSMMIGLGIIVLTLLIYFLSGAFAR